MSSNGLNLSEEPDLGDCEEEKVVTMMDVLQEQQEFEDDANAVLGASDDKNCTYSKGYIKRQAIYACLTCCADARIDETKRAGVCLACSLNCHENHELIELYTKRNFRCDCGNPKFNNHPCQFVSEKPDLNEDNNYNQNFSGLYCTCHRPYPDPEATFEDEMIQCIVCEDWLHAAHLEASVPTSEYAEMICKTCMEKNNFLHDYCDLAVNAETEDVDILTVHNAGTSSVENNTISDFSGKIESVNGATEDTNGINKSNITETDITIDKVESVATDIDNEAQKATEISDETAELKPDHQAESEDNAGTDIASPNEEFPDVNGVSTGKENEPEIIKGDDKDLASSDPKVDIENSNENDEDKCKKASAEENKMETDDQSNANSIIESIEKLENELGKAEDTEKNEENNISEETKSTVDSTDVITDKKEMTCDGTDSQTEETKCESTAEPSEKDKSESVLSKANNFELEEASHKEEVVSEINITNDSSEKQTLENDNGAMSVVTPESNGETEKEDHAKDIKRKLSTEDPEEITSKKAKLDSGCSRPKGVRRRIKGATFWPSHFRQSLCTCNECITMYKDLAVLFLTDPEDTVTAYETLGKEKIDGTATSQYEKGLAALSSLDRIQQINALTEYNKMRDKLLDFLKSFKDRKEIVKEEDIKAFFAGMKPKRESDGVYFCR